MGFEPGGMGEKLGNRYEGRWVARQLLRLLNEEIKSVTVELIGPDEPGVDLLIVKRDGTRQLQQCKARCGSRESWSISDMRNKGILDYLKEHLSRDPKQEFALVSAIPARTFGDICDSARNSNSSPKDFFQFQIQEVGEDRRKIFRDFCKALGLDPNNEEDLNRAFDYLRRTYIECFSDDRNTWSDLLARTESLLTGKPETVIAVLHTYVENNYKYRNPIYADELRRYLVENHDIHPKNLAHDQRIGPAIEELQEQFSDSIQPYLIDKKIIPREETSQIIDAIKNGRDVVVHGAAGCGKSGVLYELTEYLYKKNIPYLPIRLDRRIPDKNAKRFGKDLGLPDSPVYCLAGLAADRNCVLILDQLDAIRWTAAHSSAAMDVCKELLRQVQSERRTGKKIILVFACRSFDMENDPEIKNLLSNSRGQGGQGTVKIPVREFSDEQLKKIIGSDISALTGAQKRILYCPQNLALWMALKEEGEMPSFCSATQLMRRFWENVRLILEKKANISSEQMDAFLKPLLDYVEKEGEISAPAILGVQKPSIRDALISFGILQLGSERITFCHQRYLDYLIAERLLKRIYQGEGSVLLWLGTKENQSLFRREQLRQMLGMLVEQSPIDFFSTARELLESGGVRFHLKHLVLELIGQLDKINDDIGNYFLNLLKNDYWQEHILETVFWGHHPWVIYLLNAKVISRWLQSDEEEKVNQALKLLHSVAENIPDQVTEILTPFVDRGEEWPLRVLNAICRNEENDSEQMFELRLKLATMGHVKNYVDWQSLCTKYPLRALRLMEAVLSTWKIDDKDISTHRKSRLEAWYDQDLEALREVAKKYPTQTWDLLMPHVKRLTNIRADRYDTRLERWRDERFARPETDIARGVVDLLILAGKTLAQKQPDELIARTGSFEDSISPVVQEIIAASFTHLPASYADVGIAWLLKNCARFRLGIGYSEPEWMPAVRLINALSAYCSDELFQQLEKAIVHYHAPEEKKHAKEYLKGWRHGYFGHYWGKTQYFLLPALDANRIQPATADLIKVLERKFANYSTERFLSSGTIHGGTAGSKLDPNLEKISDRAWLKIVTSEKVKESDNRKWIQIGARQILTTSIHQFAHSLSKIAKRYPERFGQLALRFPKNVHPAYISAILEGFQKKEPGTEVPESEKNFWRPARVETIEAVLEKHLTSDHRETAISFCRLIYERADESWSDKTITRLVNYAGNHPDPEAGKLNTYRDKSCDEASVRELFQNSISCVRGMAAEAMGQLLWERKERLDQLRAGIESLISDPHPAVRMAALVAIEAVLNIDKDLAVYWFCRICKNDLRVAASPQALNFYNYIIPSHRDEIVPIIQQMVFSSLEDVAREGARQVTARWVFHDFFEEELTKCMRGTVPQRRGVVSVAAAVVHEPKYSKKCLELLRHFMNDPDKKVRDELCEIFKNKDLLGESEYEAFIKEYIKSKAFADDPDHFVWFLEDFFGSLIPFADVIISACKEFSITLREKTRYMGSRHFHMASEMSSILLRLYEQAQGKRNGKITGQCLDMWDLFFENRVGMTMEITKAIER